MLKVVDSVGLMSQPAAAPVHRHTIPLTRRVLAFISHGTCNFRWMPFRRPGCEMLHCHRLMAIVARFVRYDVSDVDMYIK